MSNTTEQTPDANGEMTTDRLAEKAQFAVDQTAARAREVEQKLREQASKASEKIEESQEKAAQSIEQSIERVESYARSKPFAAAGIAFAAGVIATALLRK